MQFTAASLNIVLVSADADQAALVQKAHEATVADTGLGVPHEVEKNLFTGLHDPSSHFAMKRKEGAGLGLVLSHQLVHLMGGQLDYRTEAGVGSSFFFTLPLRSAEKAAV